VKTSADDAPRYGLQTTRVADVEERPVNWLWPSRIASGKLTLFQGDPSVGKSTVTLDIAARITRGLAWPDRSDCFAPLGEVLLLSAEDSIADTIRPKLRAAEANLARVVVVDGKRHRGHPGISPISLETDLLDIAAELRARPDVRLLVMDPISAYLGAVDSHANADVRRVLAPIAHFAELFNVAVIAVTHLNKSGGGKAIYRGTGSLAFVAAARAAWSFTRDPNDPDRCIMAQVKNNLAKAMPGLAYRLDGEPPRVIWEADPIYVNADDMLAEESGEGDNSARQEAAEWLRSILSDGPISAVELQRRAEADGIKERTLKRAKALAGVESKREGFGGSWTWQLKDSHRGPPPPKSALPTSVAPCGDTLPPTGLPRRRSDRTAAR